MKSLLLPILAVLLLALAGCDYEAPLTSAPTRRIEPRLLGDWIGVEKDDGKEVAMHVRPWSETDYAVSTDADIYRAYHSDFAGQPFLSVQDLNSDRHAWCLYTWSLSADSAQLTLRRVDTKIVPEDTKTTDALQKLIHAHLADPKLLSPEIRFTRQVKR